MSSANRRRTRRQRTIRFYLRPLVLGIATYALVGCADSLAPTATALESSVASPPLKALSPAALPQTTVRMRIKRMTTGSPDRDMLVSVICGHQPLELASQINALTDEGGAVRFDKGLIVFGDAAALTKARSPAVVGVRFSNRLAAYVCSEDLEKAEP